MKRIHFIITGIAVMILLILFFVFWLTTGRTKVQAPGSSSNAEKLADLKIERKAALCKDFDVSDEDVKAFPNIKKMEQGSTGSLLENFPVMPAKTELCRSLLQLNSTYYITNLSADEIITYYKRELPLKGYIIQSVNRSDGGDQIVEFKNERGIGSVYTFYDRTAYSVSFTENN